MALAGRLLVNLARTIPLFPWARVTLPQITRVRLGFPPGVTVFLQTQSRAGVSSRGVPGSGPRPGGGGTSLLGLVDEGAAFAQVEVHLVPAVAALQLQQRRVLALVPQAPLVAGEDGLTPQSEGSEVNIIIISLQTPASLRPGPELTFQASLSSSGELTCRE